MTEKDIPEYLKLHTETESTPRESARTKPRRADLLKSFEEATGWTLRLVPPGDAPRTQNWSKPIGDNAGHLVLEKPTESAQETAATSLRAVAPLADAVAGLLAEIHETQRVVTHREAELAAGVPVIMRPDERQHLSDRIESILKAGVDAIQCQAAGMYLLDDATSELKLRSAWGLPKARLLQPARPLRGAMADLESLVGHAVALEDTRLLPHWKAPEPYVSAICVPIASPSVPLGTLWLFCEQTREFTDSETNLAEIIAGRLAAELERQMLLTAAAQHKQNSRAIDHTSRWQRDRLPNVKPLLELWDIAGCIEHQSRIGGCFYDWTVIPDGRLAVVIGDAQGTPTEASLTAAALQTAIRSHNVYPHSPRQLLDRVNETMWMSSSGGQIGTVFYGLIDSESGEMEFAIAGDVKAAICSDDVQLLTDTSLPLGLELDAKYRNQSTTIDAGHGLILFTESVMGAYESISSLLAACRFQQADRSAEDRLAALRGRLDVDSSWGLDRDWTVLLVQRS